MPVKTDEGTVLYWRGVMVDITAQKEAEDRLRASLDQVRQMISARRQLAQLLETAQEEERRRIATDIHDDPIQVMSAVDMRLQLLLERPDRIDAHEIGELAGGARSAIDRLRNLLFELRPVALDLEGWSPAISMYLEHAGPRRPAGRDVVDELAEEPSAESRVAFYRIAQEAIGNVRKHAHATRVEVRLRPAEDGLLLEVEDTVAASIRRGAEPGHLGLSTITNGRSSPAAGAAWRANRARTVLRAGCRSAPARAVRVGAMERWRAGTVWLAMWAPTASSSTS